VVHHGDADGLDRGERVATERATGGGEPTGGETAVQLFRHRPGLDGGKGAFRQHLHVAREPGDGAARAGEQLIDAPPIEGPARLARRTLLLVDDSDETLRPLARLLQMCGYDVRLAHTAAEALAVAAVPALADLLISDLGLPDRSGMDLMRDVRKRFGLRGIAVTGYTSDEIVGACKSAGFARHFSKPIEFDDLREAIAQLLR
jgi:CheY-like chemotaxis protein